MIADLGDTTWLMHRVGDGSTHLVDLVSGEVLLFLASSPASLNELAAHLRAFLQEDSLTPDQVAEQFLDPLVASGLIEEALA